MWDIPYMKSNAIGPETVSFMTRIATEIKKNAKEIPCGVQVICSLKHEQFKFELGFQILAGCNKEALAVSKAAGLQFIRSEGFVFSHVADEGWIDACAGALLRYRKSIQADDILIFTDIKKKHRQASIY